MVCTFLSICSYYPEFRVKRFITTITTITHATTVMAVLVEASGRQDHTLSDKASGGTLLLRPFCHTTRMSPRSWRTHHVAESVTDHMRPTAVRGIFQEPLSSVTTPAMRGDVARTVDHHRSRCKHRLHRIITRREFPRSRLVAASSRCDPEQFWRRCRVLENAQDVSRCTAVPLFSSPLDAHKPSEHLLGCGVAWYHMS